MQKMPGGFLLTGDCRGAACSTPCPRKYPGWAGRSREKFPKAKGTHLIHYVVQQFKDGHGWSALHPMTYLIVQKTTLTMSGGHKS